eukprot:7022504-Alexandrium_andersonii.AAC.1
MDPNGLALPVAPEIGSVVRGAGARYLPFFGPRCACARRRPMPDPEGQDPGAQGQAAPAPWGPHPRAELVAQTARAAWREWP